MKEWISFFLLLVNIEYKLFLFSFNKRAVTSVTSVLGALQLTSSFSIQNLFPRFLQGVKCTVTLPWVNTNKGILDGPLMLWRCSCDHSYWRTMSLLFRCWFSADTKQERLDWVEKLSQALLDLHTWSQTLTPAQSQPSDPSSSGNLRESIL